MAKDLSALREKKGTAGKPKSGYKQSDSVQGHGPDIDPKDPDANCLDKGIDPEASKEADHDIAICVSKQKKRKQKWFESDPRLEQDNSVTMAPFKVTMSRGDPAVTHRRSGEAHTAAKSKEDTKLIILHEPLTWTREKAMMCLTAACYGVHYTLDLDGTVQYHAIPWLDVCDHAGFVNNQSVGIEVINRFSTYDHNGRRISESEWRQPPGGLKTIPESGTTEWKSGQLRTPHNWTGKRKNWILPPEKQMKALYNLVGNIMWSINSIPNSFPGIEASQRTYGGFYWGNLTKGRRTWSTKDPRRKLFTEKRRFTPSSRDMEFYGDRSGLGYRNRAGHPIEHHHAGGIAAHAHAGSNHTDGLFYEHYLYLRMVDPRNFNHSDAYKLTVEAATSVCVTHKNKVKASQNTTHFLLNASAAPKPGQTFPADSSNAGAVANWSNETIQEHLAAGGSPTDIGMPSSGEGPSDMSPGVRDLEGVLGASNNDLL